MFKLHKKLLKTTHSVAELNLCTARLMDNAKFPWLILIPKRKNVRQILGDLENRIRDLELYKIRNEYGDRDEEGILVITGFENRERVINGIINGLPDTEALLTRRSIVQ